MINNPDTAKEKAEPLDRPCIAFDTSQGSAAGRFLLLDFANRGRTLIEMKPDSFHEVSRGCFNVMRDRGMLVTELAERLTINERCQAWPVIKG